MRRLLSAAVLACLAATLGVPSAAHAAVPVKVAIIVGPVGDLTPTYLHLAEAAAATAERHGASVARAYSPHATPANVLAAVADAKIVIYFGHGYGHPSPYGGLDGRRQNGWGLQGPGARGTHDDGLNGYLEYFGEDWIVANARPAPGFVMIYSNTCYAPGASEGGFAPATPASAAERVAHYSRKVFTMGGSAYFATDFDRGAADLVERLLANRGQAYGATFAGDHRFVPSALTVQPHHFSAGRQIWLHRTKYTDGPPNYWYAFAGNPEATPIRSWDPLAPTATIVSPAADATDVAPSASLSLRLSEPVTGVNMATVTLVDGGGNAVPATLQHDAAAGTVAIRPEAPLALSARYTLSVGAGVADLAGNALAPVSWTFTTRLDADPLGGDIPVVLEPGGHRLIRTGPDGSVEEEQEISLTAPRRVVATSRARLPGVRGAWFQLGAGKLAGWWVVESARAHAPGQTEEASLAVSAMSLAPNEYLLSTLVDGALVPAGDLVVRAERTVSVDRRLVVDGRTYLRLVDGAPGHAGRWIEVAPGAGPADSVANRILSRHVRPAPAQLTLEGDVPIFRFDEAGRVIERATADGAMGQPLATEHTAVLNGQRFLLITGGSLDGWWVADGPGITVVQPQPPDRT